MKKRRFIKDPVWGNIELFEWEKIVLNHFLMNRLHKVIQMSCAYQVYPGLTHTRFVHSVGVMYVATQMFCNAVKNSRGKVTINGEDRSLEEIFSSENEIVKKNLNSNANTARRCITRITGIDEDYALLLGVCRMAALLHDIGHPPYSHVFENALTRFLENSIKENQRDYKDRFKTASFRKNEWKEVEPLHRKLNDSLTPHHDVKKIKMHEMVGHNIIDTLLIDFRRESSESKDRETKPILDITTGFLDAAKSLWFKNKMPIVGSFLSADIDADRIDFIRRDGYYSGLYASAVDYERLFAFYEFAAWHPPESMPELAAESEPTRIRLKARSSPRAFSQSEKLIWERYQDYLYITAHHKVHFYDELLERIIYYSLIDGSLNEMLKFLAQICSREPGAQQLRGRKHRLNALQRLLLRFDDAFVDMEMRKWYQEDISIKADLFEAMHERRDLFISMFKKESDFYEKLRPVMGDRFHDLFVNQSSLQLYMMEIKRNKLRWECELQTKYGSEGGIDFIIGDMASKLKDGIKSKTAAEFFGLEQLKTFLSMKFQKTRLFNVWYSRNLPQKEKIEVKILEFIGGKLLELSSDDD